MQRTKGKTGEREVVNLAKEHGLSARRTWETAQQSSNRECDVVLGPAADIAPTIPFQVKRRRDFKFLYDSIENVKGVFLRGDSREWLVLLRADDFLKGTYIG